VGVPVKAAFQRACVTSERPGRNALHDSAYELKSSRGGGVGPGNL